MSTEFSISNYHFSISKILSTLALDAVLVGMALLIPTISHLTAWPIYRLNPMWLILLTGMFLVNNRWNSLLLAVAMPLVSYCVVGMPTATKALCMCAEMATLALLYPTLSRGSQSFLKSWGCLVAAMLCAKVVYYLIKAVMVGGEIVTTSPLLQILTVVGYSLLFAGISVATRPSRGRQSERDRC